MIRYLIPKIRVKDLGPMFIVAFVGAIIAGCYGVLHDQVTYSIGSEYFTKLKFKQFHFANFGLGDRVFAGCIGFLATWWVGFIVAWFLGRRLLPGQDRAVACRKIAWAIGIVFVSVMTSGIGGYLYGVWRGPDADYSAWMPAIREFQVEDTYSFVHVAYIHNAGYLGRIAWVHNRAVGNSANQNPSREYGAVSREGLK